MQTLALLIEENAFGVVRPVEVVADVPIAKLVPALVEELALPKTDLFGKRLVYTLRCAPEGRVLAQDRTLIASGVTPGARLALDSYVAEGAEAALVISTTPAYAADPVFHASDTMVDQRSLQTPNCNDTSLPLYTATPVAKQKGTWTRRAFLCAGGLVLSVSGAGLGYAAYHKFMGTAPSTTTNQIAKHPAAPAVAATQQTPVLPTKLQSILSFAHHQQIVRSVTWSPDGTMLASGADDARLLIWGTDGAIRQNIQHPGSVRALAWAADSMRLVSGAATQVAFLNAVNGNVLMSSTHRHVGMVTSLAWTRYNQQQVVSGGADMRAIVWNTTSYRAELTFTKHTNAIEAVAWSADGKTVASSSQGGVVRVWNAADGNELHGYYQDAQIRMRTLAFAPGGMQLAVGGEDGIVRFWSALVCQQPGVGNGTQCMDVPQRLQAATTAIRTLAWSPDGRFLATGADDGMLTIWYPAQGQQALLKMQQNTSVHSLVWSPDGKQLASAAGNTVTIWQLR